MGQRSSGSSDGIERLLDERRKTGEFLVRLSDPGNESPEHVRNRVREGYEKRMNEVTEELKGRRREVEASLLAKAEIRADIAAKARKVKERLEEAGVRRSVGEIDDKQWAELRSEVQGELDELREELKLVESDIAGLKDVLRSLNGGPQAGSSQRTAAGNPQAPTARPSNPAMSGRQPVGAYLKRAEERRSGRFVPSGGEAPSADRPGRPSAEQPTPSSNGKGRSTANAAGPASSATPTREEKDAGQSSDPKMAVDELAFLKSVTEDEKQGPSPKRAAGKHLQQKPSPTAARPSTPAPAPAPPAPPPPPPKKKKTDSAIVVLSEDDAPQKFPCTGCGTENPATAWYCEKCGAELTI